MNTLAIVFALLSQTPPAPSLVSIQSTVGWNQVTTNVLGQPDVITGYELSILPSGGDLNLGVDSPIRKIGTSAGGYQGTPLGTLLGGLPEGRHRLQVRAVSAANLLSAWSVPLDVSITSTGPAVPTGLRVMIQITVGTP